MSHLTCRSLTCQIGSRTIVSEVTFTVRRGQMLALVGRNGSGKSTLIRSLVGMRPAVSGSVCVDGADLSALSARERATRLAYVAQDEGPGEDLLVGEMVAMGRIPHRPPWSISEAAERPHILAALEAVGLVEQIDRPCQHLSGGERRRAMLARGLAQGSDLLILDEPTNHLDVRHQEQLMETIRGLGRTVIAAVHDLPLAAAHFDEVAVLHEGRLHAVGPPIDVLTTRTVREVFDIAATHLTDPATGRIHLTLGAGAMPVTDQRKAIS